MANACFKICWSQAVALAFAGLFSSVLYAQNEEKVPADSAVVELPSLEDPNGDGYVSEKKFSEREKQTTCRRFNREYLSYYDKVYYVEDCKLREVQSHDVILELNINKKKITPVDSDVIAKLETGRPIIESTRKTDKVRSCSQLNKEYVTYTYTDVFFVEGCKKRPFPDWASFIDHRKARGRLKEPVLALTWKEFVALETGSEMDSVIDKEYAKLSEEGSTDIIPVDEACAGVENRDVSYMDKIYRIEQCRKREYIPEAYLRMKNGKTNLQELTSEQWLSLPEGKPMPLGRDNANPNGIKAD